MDSHKSDSSMNLSGVKARSSPNSTLFHHWLWLEVNPDASLFVFDVRVRDNDVDEPHECGDPFGFSGNVFPPLVRSHDGPHGHRWDSNSALPMITAATDQEGNLAALAILSTWNGEFHHFQAFKDGPITKT